MNQYPYKDDLIEGYERGVNDYYAGIIPEGWDKPDANEDPHLAGWNHAANQENNVGIFAEDEL